MHNAPHQPLILLVEDEDSTRGALQTLLELHGYSVAAAADADDALTRLRNGLDPCLILLDLIMPGKTGFQFRYEQMDDPRLAAIPLVVYSGHSDVIFDATRLGAAACVSKPVQLPALLDVIEAHRAKPEPAHLKPAYTAK